MLHGAKAPCPAPNLLKPQGMNVLLSLKLPYRVAAAATLTIVRPGWLGPVHYKYQL